MTLAVFFLLDSTGLDLKDLGCRWTQRRVRCPNCHLFSSICCQVFTTSLCKSGINFAGIHVRYSLHALKAISQDRTSATVDSVKGSEGRQAIAATTVNTRKVDFAVPRLLVR